jgi:hypothetical protein
MSTPRHRPHNAYNIYFMLERLRLINEKGLVDKSLEGSSGTEITKHPQSLFDLVAGYDFLSLPNLPPRFEHLQLPEGWYVPGKNAKRKHVKLHGRESFALYATF